jgi:hypothetical protein
MMLGLRILTVVIPGLVPGTHFSAREGKVGRALPQRASFKQRLRDAVGPLDKPEDDNRLCDGGAAL